MTKAISRCKLFYESLQLYGEHDLPDREPRRPQGFCKLHDWIIGSPFISTQDLRLQTRNAPASSESPCITKRPPRDRSETDHVSQISLLYPTSASLYQSTSKERPSLNITLPQIPQSPIPLHRRQDTIMVKRRIIRCSLQCFRDSVA